MLIQHKYSVSEIRNFLTHLVIILIRKRLSLTSATEQNKYSGSLISTDICQTQSNIVYVNTNSSLLDICPIETMKYPQKTSNTRTQKLFLHNVLSQLQNKKNNSLMCIGKHRICFSIGVNNQQHFDRLERNFIKRLS